MAAPRFSNYFCLILLLLLSLENFGRIFLVKTHKVSEKKERQNKRNGKESVESRILVRWEVSQATETGWELERKWNENAWHWLHAKSRNMNQCAGQGWTWRQEKRKSFYIRKLKSGSCDKNTGDKELKCKGRSVCLRSISKVRNHCEVQKLV